MFMWCLIRCVAFIVFRYDQTPGSSFCQPDIFRSDQLRLFYPGQYHLCDSFSMADLLGFVTQVDQ